jgi:hypothetical protein
MEWNDDVERSLETMNEHEYHHYYLLGYVKEMELYKVMVMLV